MHARSGMIETTDATAPAAHPRPGALVWLLQDGRFGRVVSSSQGGLMCRVRLEWGEAVVDRPGGELLAVRENDSD